MKDGTGRKLNAQIAHRVGALRSARALTLDALAAKSGVSRSMLSVVERGESSPTAVVLERIAAGLGVSLATLFEDDRRPPNPLSRRQDRTAWQDPPSGYVRRNISPANFPSPLQIVEVVLPAGSVVAYETAARAVPLDQQIWVQEGRIELTLGGKTHLLATDDCFALQVDQPIVFRNRSRRPARYLVVIATPAARPGRAS